MRKKSLFMKPLTSDIQLYTAQIVIFIGAELVGSGVIEVAVKGERYMREVCTFKYAG